MTKENLQTLFESAQNASDKRDYEEAGPMAEEVLKYIGILRSENELSPEDPDSDYFVKMEHESWRILSSRALKQGNYDDAISAENHALEMAQKINEPSLIASSYITLGNIYRQQPNYASAIEWYKKSLEISESANTPEYIGKSYGSLGAVYNHLGDISTSLEYSQKALAIFRTNNSERSIAICLNNISSCYSVNGLQKYDIALEYSFEALEIAKKIGDKRSMSLNYGNIGATYINLSDYPEALKYIQLAKDISQEIGDIDLCRENFFKSGFVQKELKQYREALHSFEQSLAMAEGLNMRNSITLNLRCFGEIYSCKDFEDYDIAKAEDYLLRSIAIAEEIQAKSNTYTSCKLLANLYKASKRWEEFAIYFERYHDLKEEVQNETAVKQGQQMEEKRKVEEAERDRQVKLSTFKEKERILHQVLPAQIAERIVAGETHIADYFPSVSILFADIEGFTPMSADMPAYIVVRFLNHLFSKFDYIMKKHGCEKIKTIGDGYMAVAGAPQECADHAERITSAALEMLNALSIPDDIVEYIPDGSRLNIRIGLHTGSVVAGVVGEERFVYDIYSDAVNTAARMESHGEPGKIHVSSDFMRHLLNRFAQTKNDAHGITFMKREEMEIKGKGKMKTYFLEKLS